MIFINSFYTKFSYITSPSTLHHSFFRNVTPHIVLLTVYTLLLLFFIGVKLWNVPNPLEKNGKNFQPEINDVEDVIKIDDSSLSRHASRKRNGESLRDINPEYDDESPFHDIVSAPSGLQEELYGQSEGQHAKMSDLHIGDTGRRAFFLVPSPEGGRENGNQGDWFSKQTLEETMGTAGVMEKYEPQRVTDVSRFESPVEQRIFSEPVIKVSYRLNQRNDRLHTLPPRYKQRRQGRELSTAYHSNQVRTVSRATNKVVGPGRMKKGRPGSTSGVKTPISSSKAVDITGNVREDTIELASEGIQLQELAQSVLKRLGDQGSKFVSIQLAKHPKLKKIWANIIAGALMRQSIQIAQLNTSTETSNSSDITAHQPRNSTGTSNESKVNNDLPIEVHRGFQDSNSTNGLNPGRTVRQQFTAASQVEYQPKGDLSLSNSHSHGMSSENNIGVKDMQSVKLGTKVETPKLPVNSLTYVNKESLTTSRDDGIQDQIHETKDNETRDAQSEGRNGSRYSLESSAPQTMEGRGPLTTKVVKDLAPNRENRKEQKQASVNQKGREHFPFKAKVDSGGNNFLQLNQLSGDPEALQDSFDFIDDPYMKQQQLLNEDGKAASYLEHKINNAGQVLPDVFPSYNDTILKADSGEANYVVNSLQDDSTTTTQLAETLAGNNKMINTENLQNTQILSAVLKEDKKIASMGNKNDVQQQQSSNSRAAHVARAKAPHMQINSRTSSPSYDNQLGNAVVKEMENDLQSDMISNSYWGSSTSDLNNVEGFNEAYDVDNLEPSRIRGVQNQNEGDGQTEQLYNEDEAANFFPQYDTTPVPWTEELAQKKQEIRHRERYLEKRKRIKSLNKNIKSSTRSNAVVSKLKLKRVKKVKNRFGVKIRPKIFQTQPATRDSEITPTSVIFGLTNKDMRELEKHLAHEEHSWDGNLEPGMKSGEVKKRNKNSMERIKNKITALKKNNVFSNRSRHLRIDVQQNRRKGRHFEPSLTFFGIRENKSQARQKRNSTSLEAVSGGLSNRLNQLEVQHMMPETQRSLPEETIKDYFGQRYGNFQGFRKPASELSFDKYSTGSRSFEDSVRRIKGKRGLIDKNKTNEIGKRGLNDKNKTNEIAKRGLNDKNKRNEVGKGSIKHGNVGIKNRSRIDELKKHTPGGRQYWSGSNIIHSTKARKPAGKRDLDEFQTEFNDGTFRSPDFERQLSQVLIQENKHDLAYVGAINDVDEQGFKTMMGDPNNPRGHPKLISPKNITGSSAENDRLTRLLKSSEDLSMKENQEKLLSFFRNSNRYIKNDNSQTQPANIVGKNDWGTSNIEDNAIRDLATRRKVLTSKYKELGNVGTDGQGQLASVLLSVNRGDQRDLKELEKMDEDDEKEAQSLFTPIAGTV